jgi:hypothetical protein
LPHAPLLSRRSSEICCFADFSGATASLGRALPWLIGLVKGGHGVQPFVRTPWEGLGVSSTTVHEYVLALYRHFGCAPVANSSRAS